MSPDKEEIVLALQAAQAELEVVLQKLTSGSEPSVGVVQTTCHALRNYLCLTQFTAQMLREALRDHPSQDVHTWIEGLVRGSELMLNTVSALEPSGATGEFPIRWETVDLARMVQRFCEQHRLAANTKTVALEYHMKSRAPLGWTDRVMMASVFESIFSNAVRYSPPGKRITVTLEDVPAGVVCAVQDEGPELTAEERSLLFEPDAARSLEHTEEGDSRGYALLVAKQLADRLGVEMAYTAEPGKGCSFRIKVPTPDANTREA